LLTVIALDERTPTEYAKTIVELICPDSKEKELYLHGANK